MSRRRRGLSEEDHDLWARVAASARPMRPEQKPPAAPGAAPRPKLPAPAPEPFLPFGLGDAAPFRAPDHDIVLPVEERMAAQPLRMDRKAHRAMLRGRSAPEARLDLHGMTLAEAHPELIRFILSAQAAEKRLVLVITGKGKLRDDGGPIPQRLGILRHQVPLWLTQAPLGPAVQQLAPAHVRHGGMGALYVYLRKSR